ncbi:DegT/DnrJ/EryC1/StrS family aminotransferase [Streptomyces sp. NPDC002490]|uniref:DegT/DnrJ/EryC1/StrS family aminotransferase n=1 Tax=Streptomyces sp. NPDC002490 TaxID=3154416 RepID=UPI00331AB28D
MGTDAELRAAGIGPGDEVVVSAFGDVDTVRSITEVGAVPVFADIDPMTYGLARDAVAAVLGPRTAAVLTTPRFGRPVEREPLVELSRRHGLLVLEAEEGQPPDTRDEVALRRARAAYFDVRLRGVRVPEGSAGHTYRQYVVRVPGNGRPDRDAFARELRAERIDCRIPVRTPLHRLPQYWRNTSLPETERAADETLALPVASPFTRRQARHLVSRCNALGGGVVRSDPGAWWAAAF